MSRQPLNRTQAPESRRERLRASWKSPSSFTAIIPVDDVGYSALHDRLARLAESFQERLTRVGDLHSFRLCALPADESTQSKVSILLNCVHDRALAEHLQDLTRQAGDLLVEAFAGSNQTLLPDAIPALVGQYRVREDTFFLGSIGRGVAQIRDEQRLSDAVQLVVTDALAAGRWESDPPPEAIRRQIRDHFLTNPRGSLRALPRPLPRAARLRRFGDLLKTFLFFPFIGVLAVDINRAIARISSVWLRRIAWVAYGVWWIYGALPTAAGYLVARFLELTEREVESEPPDEELVRYLETREDLSPKNAVTILFEVRPTAIRRWYLSMILRGAELGCRHFWTDGKLTRINTIHYARIIQTHAGRGLLFMSDYDGSLNRYLDDFLGIGSRAVIPFTSNLIGCPKTRWLFQMEDRSTFGPRWKKMIRRYQLRTEVWYSAYPSLTVEEILHNAAIRDGLFSERLTDGQLRTWLRRL